MTNESLDNDALIQSDLAHDESTKPKLSLSEFLAREDLCKNSNGKYVPNNQQLKILVRYDEINLGDIDTSKITNMKDLFKNSTRQNFSGIEKWNVESVTTFMSAFDGAKYFNADISGWNVSNATNFMQMFWNATAFNQPIGKWKTTKATNTIRMFCNAKNFNQPLQEWDMSSVKWTWEMFAGAQNFNQPLDKWNVSNVEKMQSMFNRAENFNQDLSAWGDKLSKVQDMKRMFANTKSLNQTFAWKLNENCDLTNITKGSALKLEISFIGDDKQETLQDSTQSSEKVSTTQSKKFARNVSSFRIYKVATIPNNLSKLKETNNKYCLYRWIPKNIKVNYEIFFAKNSENQIISATEADWEFIYYRIFGHCFAVETDNFKLPQAINKRDILTIEQRKDDEEFDEFNFDKCPKDYKNDDIEIILEDKEHIMRIYNGDTTEINSYRILNIIGALILAKAYEAKMEYFNEQARAKDTKLTECHKKICDFDLQHYQNMPVIADLSVIHFWNKLSQRYMIEAKHKELQETISRVAQLVSEENQKKFNYLMLAVAIFSALGAILAAVPVAQSLWN